MAPNYDLDKIKFGVDRPTFEKAVDLYEKGKVTKFKEDFHWCEATVIGSQSYQVSVSTRDYDRGDCDCYLGQNDTLCKHMVAVAICAVMEGRPLAKDDKKIIENPVCSGKTGVLSEEELAALKENISSALKYVKFYSGSSKTWFAYQDSLAEGCRRLSAIISELPVGRQTAKLLIDLFLRLNKKIATGVDDSDGTVGGFIDELVLVLLEYAKLDPICSKEFEKLNGKNLGFDFEKPLLDFLENK